MKIIPVLSRQDDQRNVIYVQVPLSFCLWVIAHRVPMKCSSFFFILQNAFLSTKKIVNILH
jgi:hypothetical protein